MIDHGVRLLKWIITLIGQMLSFLLHYIILTKNGSRFNLCDLISAGDYLNHAIFERNEVVEGLIKVQKRGLILLNN
ncbi:hypothetical protein FFZ99_12660 [Leptospira interrogans]|nr:hypothetical protein B2G47_16480 [Leptospira interrogans serovar Canicola]KGE27387.1 hypothetical protein IQ65_07115 [Leptospira interrogans serovar Lai]KYZ62320.1 hypothetical protein AWU66_10740 [Leptospira interrogans serovar Pomona]TQE56766.1 hypothetical protein FF006_12490 [Leptospira interrogans]MCR8626436.1 hypothetical protein [Leptospira interrogans serovar Canicola]